MSDEAQPDAATETTDEAQPEAEAVETEAGVTDVTDADHFPRSYVQELRKESAGYRERADAASRRLFTALVAADGRLQDATDMEYSAELLDDAQKLDEAITDLVKRKPHLKSRIVTGDVGQGHRGEPAGEVNLLALLRGDR